LDYRSEQLNTVIGQVRPSVSLAGDTAPLRHHRRATATIIANDLYSAPKESQAQVGDFNLPLLLMNEHKCSIEQATQLSAKVHDDVVRLYETAEQQLLANASPLLRRYLAGVKSWVAGSLEWHRHSGRYQT
jgi:hypothetical protein